MLTPSYFFRNLGVIFDSSLTFQSHISYITKTAFYHLCNIACLRPTVRTKDTDTLIHALTTSQINYCYSLLIGLPIKKITRLQYVQNSAVSHQSSLNTLPHFFIIYIGCLFLFTFSITLFCCLPINVLL